MNKNFNTRNIRFRLLRILPVPTIFGLILSLILGLIAWPFHLNALIAASVFVTIIVAILALISIEYKLPWWNHLLLLMLACIGLVPYLAIRYFYD